MKDIVVLPSYCNNETKLRVLEENLDFLNSIAAELNFEILIHAHFPLPERIQRKCHHLIWDFSNPIPTERAMHLFYFMHANGQNLKQLHVMKDYSFAALQQFARSVFYTAALGYRNAHFYNYDLTLDSFREMFQESTKILEENGAHFYRFKSLDSGEDTIDMAHFSVKLIDAIPLFKYVTKDNYINSPNGWYGEIFFKHIADVSGIKYQIENYTEKKFRDKVVFERGDLITKPHGFLDWFLNFNVATNFDSQGQPSIFFWNLTQPIRKMKIDFGGTFVDFEREASGEAIWIPIDGTTQDIKYIKLLQINDTEFKDAFLHTDFNNFWEVNFYQILS